MVPPSHALRQVITQLLIQENKQSRDANEPAAAAARVYEQFVYRLAPLIGEAGVQAIFTRSVKLIQAEFPFLIMDNAVDPSGERGPSQIWEALKHRDSATVRKASEALLIGFAGLLVRLIGERLAWRVLFDLSPEAYTSGPEEEKTG